MTTQAVLQVLASGLLMGLIYALIAVGLSLIFGLMDVVNFAHGEFLMVAMYIAFGAWALTRIDPILLMPIVVAGMFAVGALAYGGIVRYAMRANSNVGMVQIFSTFGLAVLMQGVAQYLFTPDYRSIQTSWLGGKTVSMKTAGLLVLMAQAGLPVPAAEAEFPVEGHAESQQGGWCDESTGSGHSSILRERVRVRFSIGRNPQSVAGERSGFDRFRLRNRPPPTPRPDHLRCRRAGSGLLAPLVPGLVPIGLSNAARQGKRTRTRLHRWSAVSCPSPWPPSRS